MSPKEIYECAVKQLKNYRPAEILFWLKSFFKRFFAGQFKRNAAPDSVQVFKTSLLNKNFEMVSDAKASALLKELEGIQINDKE